MPFSIKLSSFEHENPNTGLDAKFSFSYIVCVSKVYNGTQKLHTFFCFSAPALLLWMCFFMRVIM